MNEGPGAISNNGMMLQQQKSLTFSMWSQKAESGLVFGMSRSAPGWTISNVSPSRGQVRTHLSQPGYEKGFKKGLEREDPQDDCQIQGSPLPSFQRCREASDEGADISGALKNAQHLTGLWRQECSPCVNSTQNWSLSALDYSGADWRRSALNRGCNLKVRASVVWP